MILLFPVGFRLNIFALARSEDVKHSLLSLKSKKKARTNKFQKSLQIIDTIFIYMIIQII